MKTKVTEAVLPGTNALFTISRDGDEFVSTVYAGSDLIVERYYGTEADARSAANVLWETLRTGRNNGTLPKAFQIVEDEAEAAASVVAEAEGVAQAAAGAAPVTKPGVFKMDGEVYLVKPSKAGRLYAKQLVRINGERLMADGQVKKIEFEYAPGVIFKLTEAMRMTVEETEALSIQYGRCICCGHGLKAAKSVARMIGPVCIKKYWG